MSIYEALMLSQSYYLIVISNELRRLCQTGQKNQSHALRPWVRTQKTSWGQSIRKGNLRNQHPERAEKMARKVL